MEVMKPVMTRRTVELDRINQVAEQAKKDFANHRVEHLFVGLSPKYDGPSPYSTYQGWRCAKPGDCHMAFTIYAVPGRLIVVGDIGTLVLEREVDMLSWCDKSIGDIDYFAGKVVKEIETAEYDSEMVKGWCCEIDADIINGEHDYDSSITKAWLTGGRQEVLDAIDQGKDQVYSVMAETGIIHDCDFPDFTNWKYGFIWQREALIWFLNNHYRK